jgi:hypothetical protein
MLTPIMAISIALKKNDYFFLKCIFCSMVLVIVPNLDIIQFTLMFRITILVADELETRCDTSHYCTPLHNDKVPKKGNEDSERAFSSDWQAHLINRLQRILRGVTSEIHLSRA